MNNPFLKTISTVIKHWYLPLLIGVLFLIIGLYTMFSPAEAYVTLAILFSLSFIFSGLSDLIFAIANRNEIDNWGWTLAMGILTLLVGIILYIHPEISMITLPFILGFLFLFRSVAGIGLALDMKAYGVQSWGYLMLLGVLGIILSFLMIWNPLFAGMTLVALTGLTLLTIGIFHVILALKLKKLKGKLHF